MNKNKIIKVQGRELSPEDIEMIRNLISNNPLWHRRKLSIELCKIWDWRRANGELKDMTCRALLLKLHRRKVITLPKAVIGNTNKPRRNIPEVEHSTEAIESDIRLLMPLDIINVNVYEEHKNLFLYLLSKYHYLGFNRTVGENMKYLIFDRFERVLGCVLFGSAAWKVKDRDNYIGWSSEIRERQLIYLSNNTRFLILPWVRVPNLASYTLSHILRLVNKDWEKRYGHSIYLVETFVDRSRFRGTCYQAANWKKVGETAGRTRQDRYNKIRVPIKDIYVYPLRKDFREVLCK